MGVALSESGGEHDESEPVLMVVLVGGGRVDLLIRGLPANDVSVVEWVAVAAEPAGIRADDPRCVCHARCFPAARIAQPVGESQPDRLPRMVEPRSCRDYGSTGIPERKRTRTSDRRRAALIIVGVALIALAPAKQWGERASAAVA